MMNAFQDNNTSKQQSALDEKIRRQGDKFRDRDGFVTTGNVLKGVDTPEKFMELFETAINKEAH